MRRIFGFIVIVHGLAHASAGLWTTSGAPPFFVTALWIIAAVGFVMVGGVLMGLLPFEKRLRELMAVSVVTSLLLLTLFRQPLFIPGIVTDIALSIVLVVFHNRLVIHSTDVRVGRALFL